MKGTVKFYNEGKGFGFITGEDGKDYFVHISGLGEGVSITDNDEVVFDVVEGDRGLKADKVQLAGSEEAAPAAEAEEAPAEEASAEEAPAEEEASEEQAE